MKIYSKSTTTNKTKVKLLKLPKRIENNLQLKKFMNDAITQLFTEEKANQENKDSVLTTKQKPYVLKEILTQLKQNNNIDSHLTTLRQKKKMKNRETCDTREGILVFGTTL